MQFLIKIHKCLEEAINSGPVEYSVDPDQLASEEAN